MILSDARRQLMLSFRHLIEFVRKMTGYGLTGPVNRKEYIDYSSTIDIEKADYMNFRNVKQCTTEGNKIRGEENESSKRRKTTVICKQNVRDNVFCNSKEPLRSTGITKGNEGHFGQFSLVKEAGKFDFGGLGDCHVAKLYLFIRLGDYQTNNYQNLKLLLNQQLPTF
ncbi:uncharacterized protein LOC111886244 isoform X1 [Lactuca sativa]|uniref:uncharacterized protein LOC111886244 isoform X1 n=1 Tax=Lactuca sativa TaxID=4236 RepID=UPI001C6916A7|nr:uncharacterized protein LOC111886244 isoform X1 [Lactuca sativa]